VGTKKKELLQGSTASVVTVHMNSSLGFWIGTRVLARAKRKALINDESIELRGEMRLSIRGSAYGINPFLSQAQLVGIQAHINKHLSKKDLAVKSLEANMIHFDGLYADYVTHFSIE